MRCSFHAVTASKVKSNTSSNTVGSAQAGVGNNELAQNAIADKLAEVDDVEW